MNTRIKLLLHIAWLAMAFCISFSACKVPYEPVVENSEKNLLVVEGYINTGGGQTTIKLTRTLDVKVPPLPYEEVGATLRIEGQDGSIVTAVTDSKGLATFASPLNSTQRYKLLITAKGGKKYATAFLENKQTPEIGTISYKVDGPGIQLHVSSEDKNQSTRYYAWAFDQTWEIQSPFISTKEDTGTGYIDRNPNINITYCWPTEKSNSILVGSSEKLSTDRINEFPLTFIDGKSRKLSQMYSINVFQYGLTKEAYNYLAKMKKNTEQIGSIFDPQPSELTGNIKCLSDPSESVIGFISCGLVQEERYFISSSEIKKINSEWVYRTLCVEGRMLESQWRDSLNRERLLITKVEPDLPEKSPDPFYYFAKPECVDCRSLGTNIKPSYWPN
ncbi:MAG TPA: DUF4249 domain-containing protein [Pedobacter sp.]|jgi:hypothetical protein